MKTNLALMGFTAVALALAGCSQYKVNTVSNAVSTSAINRVASTRVVMDAFLDRYLALTDLRESATNDGFKRIQVFLKNLRPRMTTFVYRFDWYDENGVEVKTAETETWKEGHVIAGDDVTLTTIAPRRNCSDFKLHLKRLD